MISNLNTKLFTFLAALFFPPPDQWKIFLFSKNKKRILCPLLKKRRPRLMVTTNSGLEIYIADGQYTLEYCGVHNRDIIST